MKSHSELRVFAAAGPGDVAGDLKSWISNADSRDSIAETYSSELFRLCKERRFSLLAISSHARADRATSGKLEAENISKRDFSSSLGYHIREILYGLQLLRRARDYRADLAIIDSGSTSWWVTGLFKLSGIPVIAKLHNALWVKGYPPTGISRVRHTLSTALPFRYLVDAALCVSPECVAQVEASTGQQCPSYLFLPQYRIERLRSTIPETSVTERANDKFRVMYLGRVELNKGAALFVEAAAICQRQGVTNIEFDIVGDGTAVSMLEALARRLRVNSVLKFFGHCDAQRSLELLSRSNLLVMPTTSQFPEALGKSMVEAALLGIPVIATNVVPATTVLGASCIQIAPDSAEEIAEAIVSLKSSVHSLSRLAAGDPAEKRKFSDRRYSLYQCLGKAVELVLDRRK